MWPVEGGSPLLCEKPARKKLTIQRAAALLRNQAKKMLGRIPAERKSLTQTATDRKYQKPAMRQITPQQATLFLIGHSTIGDQGAKELMELVFLAGSTPPRNSVPSEAAVFSPSRIYGHRAAPDCP